MRHSPIVAHAPAFTRLTSRALSVAFYAQPKEHRDHQVQDGLGLYAWVPVGGPNGNPEDSKCQLDEDDWYQERVEARRSREAMSATTPSTAKSE